ncbi:MAG: cysteine hydrolase [Marinilabiliales bacterium]|nr:cysteine hydrolase [Marinilabiliales bacterium]
MKKAEVMTKETLFWNVDTQIDFIEPSGKLYVPGAEKLKPVLKKITRFAAEKHIRVVNTCDYHQVSSAELSLSPNFVTTFPPHCMAGTNGALFIEETRPELPVVVDWSLQLAILPYLCDKTRFRNFVIRKDRFDVFTGNPYTTKLLTLLNPGRIVVYGVTTNVCVDKAVMGLVHAGLPVVVLEDAIRELPGIPLPFKKWKEAGVKMSDAGKLSKWI